MNLKNAITDVRDIEVGHAQDNEALTGCTVILCRKGAVAGVDVRGGAPGTRETDLLDPVNLVDKVHAVVLAGGSAFGLDAASGVMKYLDENKIGFNTGAAKVPIVPSAILYDLSVGRADVRPDSAMGYSAAASASTEVPAEGNVGAGTGASVGKMFGPNLSTKSGVGTASMNIGGGVIVGALAAVNTWGDVIDPNNHRRASVRKGWSAARGREKTLCRYASDDEETGWTQSVGVCLAHEYRYWGGGNKRKTDKDTGDQGGADGTGRHRPYHAPRTRHV